MNRNLLLSSDNGCMKTQSKSSSVITASAGLTVGIAATSVDEKAWPEASKTIISKVAPKEHRDESYQDRMDENAQGRSESRISMGSKDSLKKESIGNKKMLTGVRTEDTTRFDVVFVGRGGHGWKSHHCGYVYYRRLIERVKPFFLRFDGGKKAKMAMSRWIVRKVRELGGRFLEEDKTTGLFKDLGDSTAQIRTSMALRDKRHWKTFEYVDKEVEGDHPLELLDLQDMLLGCNLGRSFNGQAGFQAGFQAGSLGGAMGPTFNATNSAAMAKMMSPLAMSTGIPCPGMNTTPLPLNWNTISHKEMMMQQIPKPKFMGSSSVLDESKAMAGVGCHSFSYPCNSTSTGSSSSLLHGGHPLPPRAAIVHNNVIQDRMKMIMMQKVEQQRQRNSQRQRQLQMQRLAFQSRMFPTPPPASGTDEWMAERRLLQQKIQRDRETMMMQQSHLARVEAQQQQAVIQQQHRQRMEMHRQQVADRRFRMDMEELVLQRRQMEMKRMLQEESNLGKMLKRRIDCDKAYGDYARKMLKKIRAEDEDEGPEGTQREVEVVDVEDE